MTVQITREERALWATIDRPEALNAVDLSVMEGLEEAVETLERDPELRVLIVRGAGDRAFVSGGDLRAFERLRSAEDVATMARRMKSLLATLEALDAWTIACIDGVAYGGGCEMALAFDFRVATPRARFGFVQAKLRLVPGWGGLTRLVERVGRARALDWLGRAAIVEASEAHDAGLLDRLVEPAEIHEACQSLADELSRPDRELIGALKSGALRAGSMPHDEAIAAELEPFCELWADERHHERVRAFLERRSADESGEA